MLFCLLLCYQCAKIHIFPQSAKGLGGFLSGFPPPIEGRGEGRGFALQRYLRQTEAPGRPCGGLGGYSISFSAVAGSVDDGLRPEGDVVGVALEELAVGHAE